MKINDKKVVEVVELEPWETEGEFKVLVNSCTLFQDDLILRHISDAVIERLKDLQGHPKFDDNIDEFVVVALSSNKDGDKTL